MAKVIKTKMRREKGMEKIRTRTRFFNIFIKKILFD